MKICSFLLLLLLDHTAFSQGDSLYSACSGRNAILFPEYLGNFFSQLEQQQTVHIVQIGDSHVQISYFPKSLNAVLNDSLKGSASNSFWFPYAATGGFTPNGYAVTYSGKLEGRKMVNSKDQDKFAVTGHSLDLEPAENSLSELVIDFRYIVADKLELITEKNDQWALTSDSALVEKREIGNNLSLYTIRRDSAVRMLNLKLNAKANAAPLRIFGFRNTVDSGRIDFQYYGSSGSKFSDYVNHCDYFTQSLAFLKADLLIVSLGTNDSYLFQSNAVFYRRVSSFVKKIKTEFPGITVLFTLPPDTFYEHESPRSAAKVKDAIMKAARKYQCAVWDFGTVMGGDRSMLEWNKAGLTNEDLLHLNRIGYEIQGRLLGEALFKAYSEYKGK